jgi:alkylhydroperoxidase family enzyme
VSSRPRVQAPRQQTGNPIRDSSLALVPETLEHYISLNRAMWEAGPLPPAEIEVARLRNARKVNCVFCRSVRYDLALQDGLTEERVEQIEDGYRDSGLSEREKLILAYTDQYLDDPGGLTIELKRALTAVFSPAELVHLSMVICFLNGFSRCAVALGGMPERMPLMEVSLPE